VKEVFSFGRSTDTAAHDTIRGTTRHHRTHGRIDKGTSQKLNLWTEAQQCHQQFYRHLNVHIKTKVLTCKPIIKPALMYGYETWSLLQNAEIKLVTFERKILRRIYGPIKENGQWRCRYNTELCELYKDIDIVNDVKLRRLQWAGHVITMPEERLPRKVMMGRLEGVRLIGRPKKRWMNGVRTDAKE
jgi:hypothetical protein